MSEKARTLVFNGVKDIELREYDIPQVTDDTILVKTDACAICTWEQRVYTGVKKVDYPFIGGHELVGRIVAMGRRAKGLAANTFFQCIVYLVYLCKSILT